MNYDSAGILDRTKMDVCICIKTRIVGNNHSKFFSQERGICMKFFIDTANMEEIKEAFALGIIAGVTTNPSLVAKEKEYFFS